MWLTALSLELKPQTATTPMSKGYKRTIVVICAFWALGTVMLYIENQIKRLLSVRKKETDERVDEPAP
jgi:hypothetical protein